MNIEFSPPIRRLAAIGLLLVATALVWTIIAVPLLDVHDAALSTIDRLKPVLEYRRAAVGNITSSQAELKQLKERGYSANGLLDGTNESIAAAQLQDRLKSTVDHVGGDLKSTQVLPARDDSGFRRVTVRAELSVNVVGLQRVFYDIEASMPYLFVDNVEITRRTDGRGSNQTTEDPALEVRFDLFGYMRKAT